MKWIYFIILLALLGASSSCSEVRKRRSKSKLTRVQPFLFEAQFFLPERMKSFSFPVWFNDSLVSDYGIESIVYSSYAKPAYSDSISFPSKVQIFVFDRGGKLLQVQQKRFYENVLVENVLCRYKEVDEMGYAEVAITDSLNVNKPNEYVTYTKQEYRENYKVYQNDESGDFLFCLLNNRFQGIVSVDSLFSPTPQDIVQYGSLKRPLKRYQIENFVEERNVATFSYFRKSGSIKGWITENYPFRNKVSFKLDNQGNYQGIVDSTFSANEYLNRTTSTFVYNEKRLPEKLIHRGMGEGRYETFEYTFFD